MAISASFFSTSTQTLTWEVFCVFIQTDLMTGEAKKKKRRKGEKKRKEKRKKDQWMPQTLQTKQQNQKQTSHQPNIITSMTRKKNMIRPRRNRIKILLLIQTPYLPNRRWLLRGISIKIGVVIPICSIPPGFFSFSNNEEGKQEEEKEGGERASSPHFCLVNVW